MPLYNVWIKVGIMEQSEWENEDMERIYADDPDLAIARWRLMHPKYSDPTLLTPGGWGCSNSQIHCERVEANQRLMLSEMSDDELRSTKERIEYELKYRKTIRQRRKP